MFTSTFDRFSLRNILFILRTALYPLACILAPKETEFVSTPARNTSEHLPRKFIVILEFQPVHKAVSISVSVHRLKQDFSINGLQFCRAKFVPESVVVSLQPLWRLSVAPSDDRGQSIT